MRIYNIKFNIYTFYQNNNIWCKIKTVRAYVYLYYILCDKNIFLILEVNKKKYIIQVNQHLILPNQAYII